METPLYYIVKAKLVKKEKGKEPEFEEYQKIFINEIPIVARKEAFNYYQSSIEVLLQNKNKDYHSDLQARHDLINFIEKGETSKVVIGEREVSFSSDSLGNGIGVYLVVNQSFKFSTFTPLDKNDQVVLHGIGNFVSKYQLDEFMCFLRSEAECYEQLKLYTNNDIIEVTYCMRSAWEDGCGDISMDTFKILKTPFNWVGLEKPYWWGQNDTVQEETATEPAVQTFEDIINGGESNTVEFKPTLLYNFKTEKGGIGIKEIIAKTICAFLNSKGGFLFIGVDDNGNAQGLEYDFKLSDRRKPKDFFQLEFDQMIQHFLGFATRSNINGKIITVNEKEIFVVIVQPSSRPIFLKSQSEKKFYVRGEASSRQLFDIEDIINYCSDRFGR